MNLTYGKITYAYLPYVRYRRLYVSYVRSHLD